MRDHSMGATLEMNEPARAEHLTDSEISGYLDQDLPAEVRASVESHLDACAECRLAVAEVSRLADSHARETQRTVKPAVPPPVLRSVRPWAARRGRVAITAALAAALLVVVFGTRGTVPELEPLRSDRAVPGRSLAAVGPADGAVVSASEVVFRWQAPAEAVVRFTLLDATGAPIWLHETTENSLTLPGALELTPGDDYFWRVDELSEGITASTTARRFTVAR